MTSDIDQKKLRVAIDWISKLANVLIVKLYNNRPELLPDSNDENY